VHLLAASAAQRLCHRRGRAERAGRDRRYGPQQRLPDELESLLESAGAAWDDAGHTLAAEKLAGALELACPLGYAQGVAFGGGS
jgi:hypothetical protein